MAERTEQRILEIVVENSAAVKRMAELTRLIDEEKASRAELRKEMKEEGADRNKLYAEIVKSEQVQKTYAKELQQVSKEMQNTINMDKQKEGSLAGLRSQLSNLTAAYDTMSKAERESAQGLALRDAINETTAALKGAEEETGRWYRNVGNYTNGVLDALQKTGGAAGQVVNPIKNVTAQFKALSATPVIAILGLVAKAIGAVVNALSSSEDTFNAVNEKLSIFGAFGNAATRMLQGLGKGLANVVGWLTKQADKMGLVSEEMKTVQQLTKDQIALDKQERQNSMDNADAQLEVSKLRQQAVDKDKYSASERIAFLEEAAKLEEDIAKREKDAAAEQYRILVEKSNLTDNSKEDNDEIAAAYVRMQNAEKSYYDKTREMTSQIVAFRQEEAAATKAVVEARKAAAKAAMDEAEAILDTIAAEMDADFQAQEEREKQIFDNKTKEIQLRLEMAKEGGEQELALQKELLQRQLGMEMERLRGIEGAEELIKATREKYNYDIELLDKAHQDRLTEQQKAAEEERLKEQEKAKNDAIALEKEKQDALKSLYEGLSGLLETLGEENRAAAIASKALALAEIAINTGVAISKGTTAAAAAGGFPANLAAIATTVATILSNITAAISTVNSAKFATGGYVAGPGSGRSDSIPARLSNGESVINAQSTSMFAPLLSALNVAGGGVPIHAPTPQSAQGMVVLSEAVAAGMKAVDIRVGVDEITRKQDRVKRLKRVGVSG